MDLQGKIAVVTGASSGIGEATARALTDAGMTVIATARRRERLEQLADDHTGIHAYPADVTVLDQVQELAAWVSKEFGACHVLVNNAGVNFPRQFRSVDDLADVERAIDVNYLGPLRCMAAFADLLTASAPSRVINVASVAGKIGLDNPAYSASKFALIGFTEAVGADWQRRGVAVCQVNPGFITTEGFPQEDLMASPLTRALVGKPQHVADAIVEVARKGSRERTVPRWYRPFVVARHTAGPLFWTAAQQAASRTRGR